MVYLPQGEIAGIGGQIMPDTKAAPEDKLIRVAMLGGFRLEAGGKSVQDTDARTHQLWHLIEYLIAFRRREISQDVRI